MIAAKRPGVKGADEGILSESGGHEEKPQGQATDDSGWEPIPDRHRTAQAELHKAFLAALGDDVLEHSDLFDKPLEVELEPPLPPRARVYTYNATHPPGGRTLGEHKVQLIAPGQKRGERASFDHSGGYLPLLVGYASDTEVFILWDAGLHYNFAYSKNVQVKPETVYTALGGDIGTQERHLWGGATEVALTCTPNRLKDAILMRVDLTAERLVGGNDG